MDGSLAAIIGAAVGAVGGLGGGWLSAVGQLRQHSAQLHSDRERWRDEMRRDAYIDCLTATRQLNAAWWKVADQLTGPGSTPTDWHAALLETHDAWARFSTASSAVAVVGPRTAAAAATELHGAMREWELFGVQWARAAIADGQAHTGEYLARFESLASAKQGPLAAFQTVSRAVLQTEH
ncbi:hypothetical protein ACFV99_16965 [Streptomyces sp. NPDC059944]|uniref:hypothetical protein n=1 Tax=unclassified Streptomyces TaxID=2593676 RepID=UPI0036327075